MPAWQTDARQCAWHWREGGGLGLWAESCQLSTGFWEVVWDGPLAAFVVRHEGQVQATVVQSWTLPKGHGADIASHASRRAKFHAMARALTRVLREAGALAPAAPCQWQAITPRPAPHTPAFLALVPRDRQALAPTAQGEVPEPVCGPYGASTHGVRYFMFDLRWPARAVSVDEGQERPMFDPASIVMLR